MEMGQRVNSAGYIGNLQQSPQLKAGSSMKNTYAVLAVGPEQNCHIFAGEGEISLKTV